jgi:serine/threonine protein kinase
MTVCPSDEQLSSLLADSLGPAERGPVARHVDECASCQSKLAGWTGTPDPERWRRARPPAPTSEAEEARVRRLKRMPPHRQPAPGATGPTLDPSGLAPAVVDLGEPTVPGYEILGDLGRGGQSIVYKARQLALQRTVALKMLRTSHQASPGHLARFRAEAAVIARLQHPHIVQIYDVGEADGRPYLVLEFVAGGSLSQHLRGTSQPARAATQLVETLARAVQAAHDHGVVHRDLKPANILFGSEGSRQ